MTLRVTSRTTRLALEERFASDGEILKDTATLFGFAAAAASGEPLTLLAGLGKILEAAGAAVTAGIGLSKRLVADTDDSKWPDYDRFRVVYFTLCQRVYIDALRETLTSTDLTTNNSVEECDAKRLVVMRKKMEMAIANVQDAEVSYLISVDPNKLKFPLFDAFGEWLRAAFSFYGFEPLQTNEAVQKTIDAARRRFSVRVAANDAEARWIRNYLAIARGDQLNRISDDLATIRTTLDSWTQQKIEMKRREEEAWISYKQALEELPDQKETMFNEAFGVRKVFVKPSATYHISGGPGDAGKPNPVPDIGQLLGALISRRVSGDDLIILSGGPGSGKSTLCRVVVSELAKNPEVHPVFLRLRRLKEGAEVTGFIEESLQKQGIVERISDLRRVPNLVLVLDGFDELVMASRARLRQFFNVLREEHATGPLRGAKIIVSGRDTLFPRGEGLPTGSHVITLLPFDVKRVERWGSKWRALHSGGQGGTFDPTELIDDKPETKGRTLSPGKKSPLQHLVTWPLTLHLVARVHTSGYMNLGGRKGHELEKAYLYRSILAETSQRQMDQASGQGRLDQRKMREFLRALAWHMYVRATDSLDPADVIPIISEYFPSLSEAELFELADVAVVNSPELTKGEETGFEFVHKSFAEYLVAEHTAYAVEDVIFQSAQFGSPDLTWRRSEVEAVRILAPVLASRLLTDEVQEMLEPMLGSLDPFLRGSRVDEVVSTDYRRGGLHRVLDRLADVVNTLLCGKLLDVVAAGVQNRVLVPTPLEAHATFLAGLLLIGSASARQLRMLTADSEKDEALFTPIESDVQFWRCMCMLGAGGIIAEHSLAQRLFDGLGVQQQDRTPVSDRSIPIRLGRLKQIHGYNSEIGPALRATVQHLHAMRVRMNLTFVLLLAFTDEDDSNERLRYHFMESVRWRRRRGHAPEMEPLLTAMYESGMVDGHELSELLDDLQIMDERLYDATVHGDIKAILNSAREWLRYNPGMRRAPGDELWETLIEAMFASGRKHGANHLDKSQIVRALRKLL